MTDKEKIFAEIERRMKAAAKIEEDYKNIDKDLSAKAKIRAEVYQSMLLFIDSMPEEPKFRTGQTIRNKELGAEDTIIGIEEDHYNFRNGGALLISHQGDWELVDKDLEEVAGIYGANAAHQQYYDSNGLPVGIGEELAEAVIYGANWINAKIRKQIVDIVEKSKRPVIMIPNDEAVDGIAHPDDQEVWCNLDKFHLKDGDKVKVIILKQEED